MSVLWNKVIAIARWSRKKKRQRAAAVQMLPGARNLEL